MSAATKTGRYGRVCRATGIAALVLLSACSAASRTCEYSRVTMSSTSGPHLDIPEGCSVTRERGNGIWDVRCEDGRIGVHQM